MAELPAGTEWAYQTHTGTDYFWDTINIPVPRGLCGVGGCVFLVGHRTVPHSWEKP